MGPHDALKTSQSQNSQGYFRDDHPLEIDVGKDRFLPAGDYSQYGSTSRAVPAAYLAVALLSTQLAMLPRRVVRKIGDALEPVPGHPAQALLDYPSRIVDPMQCWTLIFRDFISRGNGFSWVRRDFRYKRPIEVVPARMVRGEFRQARAAPYQRYTLELLGTGIGTTGWGGLRHQEANSADVLSFHGPEFNGLYSPSPIAFAARNVVETMRATMEHHRNILVKGLTGNNVIVVEKDAKIGFEAWSRAVEIIREQYSGASNSGKTPALPPGLRVENLEAFSASDLQLIELLKWGVEDMARVFEISPIRLGHYHQGMRVRTFEQQAVDFERYSIAGRAEKISSQMTMKLLTVEDRQENLQINLDTSKVSLGTLSERIDAAGKAVANYKLWTPNEGRRLTGQRERKDGNDLLDPKGAPPQTKSGEGGEPDND